MKTHNHDVPREPATLDRRSALAALGLAGIGALAAGASAQPGSLPAPRVPAGAAPSGEFGPEAFGWDEQAGQFTLPKLPYASNALEPVIDAQTMEIHHTKHHAAYVAGLNAALGELKRLREGRGDLSLVRHWSRELSFHASGHINHCLFWRLMAPAGRGGSPAGELAAAIDRDFGSLDAFTAHFKAAAAQVEGGGWAWLVRDRACGRLWITQTEKQQDMFPTAASPVLGIDVWEHAYYLKYQNKRSDYVQAWMGLVNWWAAGELFAAGA
ncbi:MAG: superoxide dismutase [Phycisphaerales bacterium]|nr:superoxide dismutase [Phycisphaerales bacterium]